MNFSIYKNILIIVVEDSFQLEEEAVGPGLDVQDEVLSYDGEWMDSWRSEKTNNKSREKKKAKMRRNMRNNQLKLKGKGVKDIEPETISVIFVEHTANGELAKRLQKVEDEMAKTTGFRIRVTENAGSQLRRILPNTNPWHGKDCGRDRCMSCAQGTDKLEDCKRRNILYESSCMECNPPDTLYKKGAKLNNC